VDPNLSLTILLCTLVVMMATSLYFYIPRRRVMTQEEILSEVFKSMHNKAFFAYMLGGVAYVGGLVASLPVMFLLTFDAPNIVRIVSLDNVTHVVFYNTFTLNNDQFMIYYGFLLPAFLLVSAWGISKFEQSFDKMKAIEQAAKLKQ